ncbi:MAG: DUF1624 domain-containing protein [Planctomycetaceae bacterium]|nr:DUF1624 domain-containing protein [Planctomycetaceae bacterium]
MDQFRGYTVLGMFIVNFLGEFEHVYHTLQHNNRYFSYADTIMPAFMFAVGFSFRLTILKRLPKLGYLKTYLSYFKRSLALCLVSIALFGIGGGFKSFSEFSYDPNVLLNPNQYQQLFQIPKEDLNEEQVKSILRGTVASIEQARIPSETEQTEADKQALESKIDEITQKQFDKFMVSYNAYKDQSAYQEAEKLAEEQAALQEQIDSGEVNKENLSEEQQQLLNQKIDYPDYTSGPYFWSHMGKKFMKVLKADLWETLAIIGITQLVVLPFINLPFWFRFAAMVFMGLFHAWITHVFNWQFFYGYTEGFIYVHPDHGLNNWMSELWGTGRTGGWDGGFFGIFAWAVLMLAGSLSYDIMKGETPKTNAIKLSCWGVSFMVIAYLLSCLANFYDTNDVIEQENKAIIEANNYYSSPEDKDMSVEEFLNSKNDETRAEIEALLIEPAEESMIKGGQAASPVVPPTEQLSKRPLSSLLAPLPFMKNQGDELDSYWLMWKRLVCLPFTLFSAGFAFVVLALFVVLCDIGGIKVGIFRTFGMNPLAAYAIHEVVLHNLLPANLPEDSAPWLIILGLAVFLLIVWGMVRSLEKQNIYVRM